MAPDDGLGTKVARTLSRVASGLTHWNTLAVPSAIHGTVRWPAVTRVTDARATRVDVSKPAPIRHHYVVQSGPAYGYAMDIQHATFEAYDENDAGAPIVGVRVYAFKKPGGFAPHDRKALDAEIVTQNDQGNLRECDSASDGAYLVGGTGFGEVVVTVERPFQLLPVLSRTDVRCIDPRTLKTHLVVVLGRDGSMTVDGSAWDGTLYAVPMFDATNTAAMDAAVAELGGALWLDHRADELRGWIRDTPFIDLAGLCLSSAERAMDPPAPSPARYGAAGWLRSTLLRHGDNDDVGVVADQLCQGYARVATEPSALRALPETGGAAAAAERSYLRFVPLDDAFLSKCHTAAATRMPANSRWLWGRHPLRAKPGDPAAFKGGDVAELQTRLIQWDGLQEDDWVHLAKPVFDAALAGALVRFKHSHGVQSPWGTVSAVMDDAAFQAIDRQRPAFAVSALAESATRYPDKGINRYIQFGASNTCDRVRGGARHVTISSGFRSLPHNREVYTQASQANKLMHPSGVLVTLAELAPPNPPAPRGTYRTQGNPGNPAENSQHTFGDAVDFSFADPSLVGAALLNAVHADYEEVVDFGARNPDGSSARTHPANKDKIARVPGRLWIEPKDNQRRIHYDSAPVLRDWSPDPCVLSPPFNTFGDRERNGPSFLDGVVVYGTVTGARGEPEPYARVVLTGPGIHDVEVYADAAGRYAAYGKGSSGTATYSVEVTAAADAWEVRSIAGLPGFEEATDRVKRPHAGVGHTARLQITAGTPVCHDVSVQPLGDFVARRDIAGTA